MDRPYIILDNYYCSVLYIILLLLLLFYCYNESVVGEIQELFLTGTNFYCEESIKLIINQLDY